MKCNECLFDYSVTPTDHICGFYNKQFDPSDNLVDTYRPVFCLDKNLKFVNIRAELHYAYFDLEHSIKVSNPDDGVCLSDVECYLYELNGVIEKLNHVITIDTYDSCEDNKNGI